MAHRSPHAAEAKNTAALVRTESVRVGAPITTKESLKPQIFRTRWTTFEIVTDSPGIVKVPSVLMLLSAALMGDVLQPGMSTEDGNSRCCEGSTSPAFR